MLSLLHVDLTCTAHICSAHTECLTFELQTLHGDLFDVRCGTHVKLPDFDVNAQMGNTEDQKRKFLLLFEFLQGQQGLSEEPAKAR